MEDKQISQALRPKYFAQRCPSCNGFTTVSYGQKTCQTCKGKGYVEVPYQEEDEDRGGTYDYR